MLYTPCWALPIHRKLNLHTLSCHCLQKNLRSGGPLLCADRRKAKTLNPRFKGQLRQLEYQKQTDEKLEHIFEYISEHEKSNQKIFFDGQIYDAFSLIVSLI